MQNKYDWILPTGRGTYEIKSRSPLQTVSYYCSESRFHYGGFNISLLKIVRDSSPFSKDT
jgi:hypothetical protein